jgi:hypothetical protein
MIHSTLSVLENIHGTLQTRCVLACNVSPLSEVLKHVMVRYNMILATITVPKDVRGKEEQRKGVE